MYKEDEAINKEAQGFIPSFMLSLPIELLAFAGLVLYMLGIVDFPVFVVILIMTWALLIAFFWMQNNKMAALVRNATDQNIAIVRNAFRAGDLNDIKDLTAHNNDQLLVVRILHLSNMMTPLVVLMVGLIVGQI